MDTRIPAHLEVAGLIRAVQAAGGFATVLAKGERDAGTLLVICCHNGRDCVAWERMPLPDGTRGWAVAKRQDPENPAEFTEYYTSRHRQDVDLWVIELDILNAQRFIDGAGTSS
jgi:hypothetical protein